MPVRVPSKKQTLLAYLSRGVTMIHLDARRPGVAVPSQYAQEAHLRLNLSYRYAIPDLEMGEARLQATLSFGGKQFHCLIPWEAIFGITHNASGDGQVWPEDLPVEVMQTMAERDRKPAPQHQPEPARMRPALSAVPDEDDASTQPEPPKAPGSKRHLRLVR